METHMISHRWSYFGKNAWGQCNGRGRCWQRTITRRNIGMVLEQHPCHHFTWQQQDQNCGKDIWVRSQATELHWCIFFKEIWYVSTYEVVKRPTPCQSNTGCPWTDNDRKMKKTYQHESPFTHKQERSYHLYDFMTQLINYNPIMWKQWF